MKVRILSVCVFIISGAALFESGAMHTPPGTWMRLLVVVAILALAIVFNAAWGVLAADLARKRQWSARMCRRCGLPQFALGLIWTMVRVTRTGPIVYWPMALFTTAWLAGLICRRLAYPELGWSSPDPQQASRHVA